ncbi:MAG: DUF1573 domain-containing protein [Saprospiraceae bacterium]
MSRLFYFILLNIGLLMLLTQCKEASTTEKVIRQSPVEEETAKAITEPIKKLTKVVDSVVLAKKEVVEEKIVEKKPIEKVATTTKKIPTKTTATVEKKAETKPIKKKKKKRAKIKFDELVHKYGTITTGDKVNHQFKFKNTGNAPLVIKSVDVSCGCTFPSYPFLPIEPGKEGAIDVTFDSKNKVGRQKPTITVVTNGRPRTIKLNLEGFVE